MKRFQWYKYCQYFRCTNFNLKSDAFDQFQDKSQQLTVMRVSIYRCNDHIVFICVTNAPHAFPSFERADYFSLHIVYIYIYRWNVNATIHKQFRFFCTGGRTRPLPNNENLHLHNDRSTQSAQGRKCFPPCAGKVLTKLQSLRLESMRGNFHVKLPYITIDKISGIVLGPYGRKFQSCNGFAFQRTTSEWRHMYSCFAMFAIRSIRYSYAKFISGLFYTLDLPNSGQNFSQWK